MKTMYITGMQYFHIEEKYMYMEQGLMLWGWQKYTYQKQS